MAPIGNEQELANRPERYRLTTASEELLGRAKSGFKKSVLSDYINNAI